MAMRIILFVFVLGVAGVHVVSGQPPKAEASSTAVASVTADQYLREQIETVFDQLGDQDLNESVRAQRFKTLITKIFDVKFISRFVLGPHWSDTTEAERARFSDLLIELQVTRWAQRFKPRKGDGTIEIGTLRTDERGHHLVPMTLKRSGADASEVSLLWRLRRVEDSYKVFDIMVEGTSMLIAHKSEYQSFIRRNGGVSSLIDELETQIQKLKKPQ